MLARDSWLSSCIELRLFFLDVLFNVGQNKLHSGSKKSLFYLKCDPEYISVFVLNCTNYCFGGKLAAIPAGIALKKLPNTIKSLDTNN